MAQAAQGTAQAKGNAVATATRNAYAKHHEVVRTGRGGDGHGGKQESEKLFGAEHEGMLAALAVKP